MLKILGIISGLLMFFSVIPYIIDTLKFKTKPQRTSWFIWTVLGSIALFSQFAEGGTWSLLFTVGNVLSLAIIFILSIKHGVGGFMKRDIVALCGASLSLILWYLTKEPAIALFIVIFIDGIGATLTIIKSYENPHTETLSTWALSVLGAFIGILAVGKFDPILMAYPAYLFIADGLTVLIILARRKKLKQKTP